MRIGKVLFIAAAASLALAGAVEAIVPHMTLEEMTQNSDVIVYGRVSSLVSHWNDEHTLILTTVTFEPLEYLKGEGQGPITFEAPGGTVGELTLVASDVPKFRVGEEAVLFLRPEYFRVVGWNQGKLSVENGIVAGHNMTVEQFHVKIAELSGVDTREQGVRTRDGAVIRRFSVAVPAEVRESIGARPGKADGAEAGGGESRAPAANVTIMTEDFEGTFPAAGWSLTDQGGTGHKWGKETFRKHGGSYSMWECAAGASALPSGADYANDVTTWAVYGPFDLSDATSAELRFWRSIQTASSDDYLAYMSSADGTHFDGFITYLGDGSWAYATLDLATRLGDGSVWIAFMFASDASGTNKGAFVDDIELVKTTAGAGSPQVTGIVPDTGPAGQHFSVTINGSNFGATQGSSTVEFTLDPMGSPSTVEANVITFWSDTQIVCEVPETASSGPVHVVVGADPGIGADFTVTYGASSTWWQNAEPMGENMLINPNTADVPAADALAACIKGFQEWNAESGGDFSYTYGGATGATAYSYNGLNEVAWGTTGGSLATNYSWFIGQSMMENDIIFDDVWNWSASGEPSKYDIQSVFTHELGHCLRLLDLYGTADVDKTMYGRISAGDTGHRTIELADKQGLQHFYGAQTLNITTRDLPDATSPVFYSASITAVGGTPPYTFELRAGPALPNGFSLSSSGEVSGFAKESGVFYFNVRVTDGASDTDSQVIRLFVDSAAPVALESFSATPVADGILLEWDVPAGLDPGKFYVRRSAALSDGQYELLTEQPVGPADPVRGSFAYLDRRVVDGTLYFYKLESTDGFTFGPASAVASLGRDAAAWLGQNTPNPFSPTSDGITVISFSVPSPALAVVRVYDAAGRLVAVPFRGSVFAGRSEVTWDGVDSNGNPAASGIYFYEIVAGQFRSTRKMTVLR